MGGCGGAEFGEWVLSKEPCPTSCHAARALCPHQCHTAAGWLSWDFYSPLFDLRPKLFAYIILAEHVTHFSLPQCP